MKILMVAYFYPPRGGGGVQRTVKFAKYLPSFDIARTPKFDLRANLRQFHFPLQYLKQASSEFFGDGAF